MASEMITVKNNPNSSQWSLENGYEVKSNEAVYPVRVTDTGQRVALDVVLLFRERDFTMNCTGFNQGFRVILTPPGIELTVPWNAYRVPLSENTQIAITPKLTITSDGLRGYEPYQRQCFYQHERQLRFFNIYTQDNCEAECLANFTKTECGCVKFAMPRDKNTPICNVSSLSCCEYAHGFYFGRSFYTTSGGCNCLPACTSIEYNAQLDRVKFDSVAINKISGIQTNRSEPGIQQTRVAIFFSTMEVETVKRVVMYTVGDFLAICGGLLGLLMGISALSIVELVYYLTLRWFWAIRNQKVENAMESSD
ncbi:pickpocket protein 28-like [Sitodiplosis mosellana]|uniref:pickpocket protein 28-like n=1 Tax=Sitodiplosis mosellana TaxID=263140 RepID=UPI0024447477|nr:pickpocket protein 28-like [Sitodiplosis mosellana]